MIAASGADRLCECQHDSDHHDEHGRCWHVDQSGDEDCGCAQFRVASGADRDRYWLCDDGCTTDCGVCKGAGPPPASYRDQLDQLVLKHWRTPTSGCVCGGLLLGQSYSRHLADALLPVVERAKAEAAAEALEDAAARVPRWSPEVIAKWLRDRAAALRATAGHS